MAKKYTVFHFKNGCIGCGSCVALCGKYWEITEDGLAHLKGSTLQEGVKEVVYALELDDPECNMDARDVCPVQIIKVKAVKQDGKKNS